jgi:hypothetical protein
MVIVRFVSDHQSMNEHGLHYVEDDLREGWVEEWATAGVADLEDYLAKHGAFLDFLGGEE